GVMVRSFLKLYTTDVGVKATNDVIAVQLSLPESRYRDAAAEIAFVDALDARLPAIPGVESSAIASVLTMNRLGGTPYELAGAPPVDAQRRPTLATVSIAPAYFSMLG